MVTTLDHDSKLALDRLAAVIERRRPVVAFTGAGISTDSGIPDYRGKNGLWTTGKAQPQTFEEFMNDPDLRRNWWSDLPERLKSARRMEPNVGHRVLVELERHEIVAATVTQNIDGLHIDAGSTSDRVIELHGNNKTIRCTECGTVWPTEDFLAEHAGYEEPPPCSVCGGVVKNGTIAFGQPMPERELRQAFAVAQEAEVMLVLGSTLLVNPAARVPAVAKAAGAHLAIVNIGETALDSYADTRIEGPVGPALSYLNDRLLDQNRASG
ncbi:MAG: SIR2 family NAD-dependent protein deacylase [Chloroflexota bacterium]